MCARRSSHHHFVCHLLSPDAGASQKCAIPPQYTIYINVYVLRPRERALTFIFNWDISLASLSDCFSFPPTKLLQKNAARVASHRPLCVKSQKSERETLLHSLAARTPWSSIVNPMHAVHSARTFRAAAARQWPPANRLGVCDVKKRILRETNAGQKQMVQVLQSKAGNWEL